MSIRLLITARDVAAALHLIEVVRVAGEHPDLELAVITQPPASAYFHRAGIDTEALDLAVATERDSAQAQALLSAAEAVLARVQPDAVLCGLSTPMDGGIDEAVLAKFRGPSFVMQDFWGEANRFFGAAADLYLALDDEGVRLSRERHGLDAVIVGSPRHSAYRHLDIHATRDAVRRRLGTPPGKAVIGYFGQALHDLAGYRRTLFAWAEAVLREPGYYFTVYRPHPRETQAQRDWTMRTLGDVGVGSVLMADTDVEHALLACDVVCSAFSNCTYDVAYLNRFSSSPLITPVSLFFDEEIVDYFRRMVKLEEFPYLKAGLVMAVRSREELGEAVLAAAQDEQKRRFWNAAQQLPDPQHSPERVLHLIRQRLAERA